VKQIIAGDDTLKDAMTGEASVCLKKLTVLRGYRPLRVLYPEKLSKVNFTL